MTPSQVNDFKEAPCKQGPREEYHMGYRGFPHEPLWAVGSAKTVFINASPDWKGGNLEI